MNTLMRKLRDRALSCRWSRTKSVDGQTFHAVIRDDKPNTKKVYVYLFPNNSVEVFVFEPNAEIVCINLSPAEQAWFIQEVIQEVNEKSELPRDKKNRDMLEELLSGEQE